MPNTGRKLILPGLAISDTTAPKLAAIDPIESSGSLILVDPTHPAQQWAAGVPASGSAVIPNLFAQNAKTLVGTGGDALLPFSKGVGWGTSKGLIERSSKGGLHSVPSPTLGTAVDLALVMHLIGHAINAYLFANLSHAFFISSWLRTTKKSSIANPGDTNSTIHNISNRNQQGANYLAWARLSGGYPTGRSASAELGPQIANNPANNAWIGTAPTTVDDFRVGFFSGLNTAWAFDDSRVRQIGGRINYRFYLEDLTVSGRSYAQVDALDYALYEKEVLTAGGRYNGDTYTNPSTVA